MKVLWAAYYEFLKYIRNIYFLVALVAYPISMILMLGTVFDGNLSEDINGKVPIGYVISDDGEVGKGFETMLSTAEISELVTANSYSTENDAIKDLDASKIDSYFLVPENTSEKFKNGEETTINIKGNKNIELVQTILDGYVSKVNAHSEAIKIAQKPLNVAGGKYLNRITPLNKELPKAIDYYSVLTLLQIIGLGSILGIFVVSRDKESNIHIRLYALPTSKWTVIYGRVIGSSICLFISCIITVIFTKYVFNANWDGNLAVIGLALFSFSFLNIGIGILIGSLTKSLASAIGGSFLVMFITSVAAGAIAPSFAMPSINIINPIYYTKVLIFGTLYSYPDQVMIKSALGLLAMIVIIYFLSFLKLRRVNYDNI